MNYMYTQGIQGCSFVACNTDSQALSRCSVPVKIQMGQGLGAGTNPTRGRNAAIESQDEIAAKVLDSSTKMLFITAGMGGGTGTGAAPVIAKMSKDRGILTVAVVTIPFHNEGYKTLGRAIDGVHELENNVDSLIIINNEKLYEYYGDQLAHDAFPKADEVLCTAVRGIIEIIKKPGFINVDFEDIKTMMKNSGMALMGYGSGSGPDRIEKALGEAFHSPLLNDFDLCSAKNVLVNITGGKNEKGLKMEDINEINRKIDEYTGGANNFKHGLIWEDDPEIGDSIHITSIVTGLKFADVLGPEKDMGNYIIIDRDYVFDKGHSDGEEYSLANSEPSTLISRGSNENTPGYHFDPDTVPALLKTSREDISELEEIPSIKRARN